MLALNFAFVVLLGLDFMLFPCRGTIFLESGETTRCVDPGSNVTIEWTHNTLPSNLGFGAWRFKELETLARLSDKNVVTKLNSSLPSFEIEPSGTLILKDVDSRYNGTYEFQIAGVLKLDNDVSYVTVFVAVKPNVAVCSSPLTVNEGDNVTCLCRGEGGNPPANVTWFDKDGNQIGDRKVEQNMLTLDNATRADNSSVYKCVAQSCGQKNETLIELIVNHPPGTPVFNNENIVEVGTKNFIIECETDGYPLPSYEIFHNTTIVSKMNTYNISIVKLQDSGSYKCVAVNRLGNSSTTFVLNVAAPTSSTLTTAPEHHNCRYKWWKILLIVLGFLGLMAMLLLMWLNVKKDLCSKCWEMLLIVVISLASFAVIVSIIGSCIEERGKGEAWEIVLIVLAVIVVLVTIIGIVVKWKHYWEPEKRANGASLDNRTEDNQYVDVPSRSNEKTPEVPRIGGNNSVGQYDVVHPLPDNRETTTLGNQYDVVNLPATSNAGAPGSGNSIGQYDVVNLPSVNNARGGGYSSEYATPYNDGPPEDSGAKSPADDTTKDSAAKPPVYATVNKPRNYASLDTIAMQPRDLEKKPQSEKTEYATVQFT